eukprot:CAMPEP_0198124434 /NCGR_PEP_ID=MMETSP1442-20131203/39881_1 /TAXON_ID= /ORGANISM="Craspedostauros australis, Strain CCMP3328" /LENGTH=54 /DNA_ID=CAMNT_0043783821 /DNA_START=543 /DNA_END=707 /DNA_ORIENTATION=+
MANELPVPPQLEKQLSKCNTVRKADEYYKSREKTAKEIKESKAKLPPLPVPEAK